MGLQVRFTFSDELMEQNGIERKDVYYTLKRILSREGLCVFQRMKY